MKKVLDERILNGKVEFTLNEVVGILKREFHEVIVDIIKRKRHSLGDTTTTDAQGVKVGEDEEDEGVVDHVHGNVARMGSIPEEGEIQASSHYSQSHWARARTETLVKLGDLEEPIFALVDHGSEINLMSKELYTCTSKASGPLIQTTVG